MKKSPNFFSLLFGKFKKMLYLCIRKRKDMKEIHFYTNLTNEEQTSEWDLDTMQVDYFTTNKAIEDPEEKIVKTTQLSFLQNSWNYINRGDKVFIHNGNKVLEVKEHMDGTEKNIRVGHNIQTLLLGGTFGLIE